MSLFFARTILKATFELPWVPRASGRSDRTVWAIQAQIVDPDWVGARRGGGFVIPLTGRYFDPRCTHLGDSWGFPWPGSHVVGAQLQAVFVRFHPDCTCR